MNKPQHRNTRHVLTGCKMLLKVQNSLPVESKYLIKLKCWRIKKKSVNSKRKLRTREITTEI